MGEKAGFLPFPKSFETICIHNGLDPNLWKSKSVIPHIVPSTIFKIDDPRVPRKFTYSRLGNPNRSMLEKTMAAINKAKYAVCFASGVSALTGLLGLIKPGNHMVCCDDVSPETHELFDKVGSKYGTCTTFIDFNNTDTLCSAIQDNTKLIWLENPSHTTLKISDICTLGIIAKEKEVLFGVDNTFLTPYLQRPLELGADIVMQSMTKYINGHSDIIMGSLCTNKLDVYEQLVLMQTGAGLHPSPFECYQALRGIKTLHLRMDQHLKNSIIIANYLGQHSAIEKVIHPGLKTHPNHDLFRTQASGHSGIVSFYLKGDLGHCEQFLKALKIFTIADVVGGSESTAEIPFVMSHRHWRKEKKTKLNITENLVKLSVGLESICSLILDIESALDSTKQKTECE